ncbi:hypothetical protein HYN49_04410 [Flavobacterium pallidum]|uniref:Uncharacterized protein n=2 Tax=Flavobacterium pallidum TaxID=2172098 RepID=A0A2S1SFK9_9FLAO|nr:hypothetical protein HYN49_04410 [Flavobacterium pallidum]
MMLLSLVMARSCDKQENEEMKNTTVEYSAVSRGKYLNINFHDDKLSIIDKRDGTPRDYILANADWKALAKLYKTIKLEALSTYKDPTQKRFYDGAAVASLRVIYDGKTYETTSFDHGFPPKEIEEFVNKIVSFATPSTQ